MISRTMSTVSAVVGELFEWIGYPMYMWGLDQTERAMLGKLVELVEKNQRVQFADHAAMAIPGFPDSYQQVAQEGIDNEEYLAKELLKKGIAPWRVQAVRQATA